MDTSNTACLGILPISFLTAPQWDQLKDVRDELLDKAEADRDTRCNKPPCGTQKVRTLVNPQARRIPFEYLGDTYAIVAGAMRFHWAGPPDYTYNTGDDLGVFGDTKRIYVVAHSLNTGTTPVPPEVVNVRKPIARWTMFKIVHAGPLGLFKRSVEPTGRTGFIWKCAKPHPKVDVTKPDAAFQTCEGDMNVKQIAEELGKSMDETMDARNCVVEGSRCSGENNSRFKIFTANMTPQSIDALATRLTLFAKPAVDPYWFSCSLGCCTAMM